MTNPLRDWTPIRRGRKWIVARADGSEQHRGQRNRYGPNGNIIVFTHWAPACARAGRLNRQEAS